MHMCVSWCHRIKSGATDTFHNMVKLQSRCSVFVARAAGTASHMRDRRGTRPSSVHQFRQRSRVLPLRIGRCRRTLATCSVRPTAASLRLFKPHLSILHCAATPWPFYPILIGAGTARRSCHANIQTTGSLTNARHTPLPASQCEHH